jgi:hypothetical protein
VLGNAPSNTFTLLSTDFSTAFSVYFSGWVSESWILSKVIPSTGTFLETNILAFLALVIPVYKSYR